MSGSNLGLHNATMKEIVADGAEIGTFQRSDRYTVHAYVELGLAGGHPYMACGVHELSAWRKHYPETMDCHGGTSAVTCGRCRRVLGDALEEAR